MELGSATNCTTSAVWAFFGGLAIVGRLQVIVVLAVKHPLIDIARYAKEAKAVAVREFMHRQRVLAIESGICSAIGIVALRGAIESIGVRAAPIGPAGAG